MVHLLRKNCLEKQKLFEVARITKSCSKRQKLPMTIGSVRGRGVEVFCLDHIVIGGIGELVIANRV